MGCRWSQIQSSVRKLAYWKPKRTKIVIAGLGCSGKSALLNAIAHTMIWEQRNGFFKETRHFENAALDIVEWPGIRNEGDISMSIETIPKDAIVILVIPVDASDEKLILLKQYATKMIQPVMYVVTKSDTLDCCIRDRHQTRLSQLFYFPVFVPTYHYAVSGQYVYETHVAEACVSLLEMAID